MTEKPEALFEGVEWERENRAKYHAKLFGVGVSLTRSTFYGNGWTGFAFGEKRGPCDLEEALTWLRAKVIEARDELCRVTGTKAVEL